MARPRLLAFALALCAVVLILAACGDDDGSETSTGAAPESSPAGDSADEPSDAGGTGAGVTPTSGGAGSFNVDGATFDADVFRCALEEDFYGEMPNPDDLDLVARLGTGGLSLKLIHRDDGRGPAAELFDQQIHELRLNADGAEFSNRAADNYEGAWFLGGVPGLGDQEPGDPLGEAPFAVAGDRIVGAMSLVQDYPDDETGTVEVSFDLPIPSDSLEC